MKINQKLIESKLAENFANELKNLQKEGLFENVKSFDLDFTGRGINIKLNEMAYKDDYEEYSKKRKDYVNYDDRSWRQLYALKNKMYRLKPVSFTFDGETFTLKNTDINHVDGFGTLEYLNYIIEFTNSSGVIDTFSIDSLHINIDKAHQFSSAQMALQGRVSGRNSLYGIAGNLRDLADIRHRDEEAFEEAFAEAFIEFIQPLLSREAKTIEHDDKFLSIKNNRFKKVVDARNSAQLARHNAYGSWRKEHFGVEGYEVGQTVEVFDGRNGEARSLGKIIKITPSGTATIQLEDGTTIVRRHIEDDENIVLFEPSKNKYHSYITPDADLIDPSTSTEDAIATRKHVLGLE